MVKYVCFHPNVKEVFVKDKTIATINNHTNEEAFDQEKAEDLRQKALKF